MPADHPATVVDLRVALVELREYTLIAAALARLAARAMVQHGATPKVRGLMQRAARAAEHARDRARAVEEAASIGFRPRGQA